MITIVLTSVEANDLMCIVIAVIAGIQRFDACIHLNNSAENTEGQFRRLSERMLIKSGPVLVYMPASNNLQVSLSQVLL